MVRLFQKLADIVVKSGMCDFSINLYSGNIECITAFHMMQFGNMSEKCEKLLESKDISEGVFDIRVLRKEEIERNWKEIWDATERIVKHLQLSPVFYPGNEFTEEVYPAYRGTGLAEKFLRFAESRAIAEGYRYMWVEHGTANPNARGFWNKYFTTYQYELVRRI